MVEFVGQYSFEGQLSSFVVVAAVESLASVGLVASCTLVVDLALVLAADIWEDTEAALSAASFVAVLVVYRVS